LRDTVYISILITTVFFSVGIGFAFGQSDFYLEAKATDDFLEPLKIQKFEMNGTGYKEICPSLQCKIDYKDRSTFFSRPSPEDQYISYTADFRLQDDITNADMGPKKKEAFEQYSATMYACQVDDIIEENGQELYICHTNDNTISRNFDKKSWDLDTMGEFDAKTDILKISGNFTGSSP
jgi:hypothetical protein